MQTSKNCDNCKYYRWYYDHCDKWDCEVDAREVHDCFEKRLKETLNQYEQPTVFQWKLKKKTPCKA